MDAHTIGPLSRAAGIVLAGAALVLGACAPAAPPPTTTAALPASAAPAPAPAPADPTPSGTPTTDGAPTAKCTTPDLSASLTRLPGDPRFPDQPHAGIVWRNVSNRACTMYGFGGVDLNGPDFRLPAAGDLGPTFSLRRSTEHPAVVRLAPGATAVTEIPFSPGNGSGPGSWTPTEAVVTPPDETRSQVVPWTFGPVVRQDAATRPGTFIDPVRPG